MATRTQAREAVIGMLYAYDVGNTQILEVAKDMLIEQKIKNKQQDFALSLLEGTIKHIAELDKRIESCLKEWDLYRLGGMEKAMLRLGAYELIFTSTDAPIVINEAVNFSKSYGGEDSTPRLINAVLDRLHKTQLEG